MESDKKSLKEIEEKGFEVDDRAEMEVGYLAYAHSQHWWFEVMKWLPWGSCQRIDRTPKSQDEESSSLRSVLESRIRG